MRAHNETFHAGNWPVLT